MTQRLFVASGIFHPESGGPATYLYEILPALQQRGWSVDVMSYGDSTQADYGYPVTRIPRRAFPVRLVDYWWQARPHAAQADLIYAHTIDLPVTWGDTPRLIKIVGDQAWERCVRKGWVAPTEDIDAFQTKAYGALVNRQRASRSRQVRAFDGVIVPSEYLRQMVIGWGVPASNVHVIYNALPPAPDDVPTSQEEARHALQWDERPTILTAARLEAWKGVDHLIEAVQQLPDVRLVVAGDGPQMPRLRALAAAMGDRVQLPGRVPRQTLFQMMKAADYFALYSGYEGLPHTVLEALSVGTPVIASDKGGNPEVVQHNVNGLLVRYLDKHHLQETLRNAFRGGTRQHLAAHTTATIQQFTFEQMTAETDRILKHYL